MKVQVSAELVALDLDSEDEQKNFKVSMCLDSPNKTTMIRYREVLLSLCSNAVSAMEGL